MFAFDKQGHTQFFSKFTLLQRIEFQSSDLDTNCHRIHVRQSEV